MENIHETSGTYFKSLKIVLLSLVAGLVIFCLLVLYLVNARLIEKNGKDLNDIFMYMIPVFFVFGLISSHLVFKKRLSGIDKSSLKTKLTDYRSALIVKWALLEGPALFAIVVSLITGNMIFMAFAVFIIIYFMTMIPDREKAIRDLDLELKEEEILNDPEKEI